MYTLEVFHIKVTHTFNLCTSFFSTLPSYARISSTYSWNMYTWWIWFLHMYPACQRILSILSRGIKFFYRRSSSYDNWFFLYWHPLLVSFLCEHPNSEFCLHRYAHNPLWTWPKIPICPLFPSYCILVFTYPQCANDVRHLGEPTIITLTFVSRN